MTANPSLAKNSSTPGAVSILSYAILLGGVITIGLASPRECIGQVESTVPMPGVAGGLAALRITGRAWDYKHRRPPSMIAATTDGVITGIGAVGDWRPVDKRTRPSTTTNYIGYTGYVQAGRMSGPVEVYAILPGRPATACMIATVK